MDFGLSQDQLALTDSITRVLDREAGLEQVRACVESGDDGAIWTALVELGVPALLVPEDQGGVGLGLLDMALIAECLGHHATPAPFIGSAVIAPLALQQAPAAVREQHLGALLDGSRSAGFAFSELCGARDGAGVDVSGKLLSGRALFVFDAQAPLQVVATRERQLFLVEAGAAGFEQGLHRTIDRTRASGELRFTQTPAVCLSDDPACVDHLLDCARVMLLADTLGAAQYMLNAAVAYAQTRKQFGRLIGSFQAVKHLCAEMAAELEPCRAMMWYAAHALEHLPAETRMTTCQAKAHIAEVGTFVARTATEVHGGIGFTDLLGLHYWFKRIGFNRQALGSPEHLREQAALLQGL